jgi:hypothetical protein
MARARNIKPAFFSNEDLAELCPLTRLAFIAMWTIADFKGCIELKPKRLKVQTLPYDDCDIEQICTNLERSRFIAIYSVQGQRHIKILNFQKHQNPHKNEKDAGSEIPDFVQNEKIDSNINGLTKDGTKTDFIGTARADSLNPLTDSLLLIPSDTHTATPAGIVCRRLRDLGFSDAHAGHQGLKDLLPETWPPDFDFSEWDYAATKTLEANKGFAYLLGVVKGSRQDLARKPPALPSAHTGFEQRNYGTEIASL